jgi:cytochrome c peroxidase
MKKTTFVTLLALSFIFYIGCKKEDIAASGYSSTPVLPASPYDYTQSSNDQLATLGRVLFYDQKLSLNNSVACGSCHMQSKAFADGKQFSAGLEGGLTRRNSPPVIAHTGGLFWDGRAQDFKQLALMPLVNHVEMKNYDIAKLEEKLRSISYYPELFEQAFGTSDINIDKVQTALGEFLSNFKFDNNKLHQTWNSGNQFSALELKGNDLFWGKARCGQCHSGSALEGWNAGECIGLDESYTDNGIGERTGNAEFNGMFRVPPLFNIAYTAPYMHDGRFQTLEEVIDHYNSGIQKHPNLSWVLQDFDQPINFWQMDINGDGILSNDEMPAGQPTRLGLTADEKEALVAFLKALSDPSVYTDVRFSDPFVIH